MQVMKLTKREIAHTIRHWDTTYAPDSALHMIKKLLSEQGIEDNTRTRFHINTLIGKIIAEEQNYVDAK